MRTIAESGELATLAPERVWTELAKALATDKPSVFVQVLRDCGALARLLPELDRLFGVPQPVAHHPEVDSGVHTLMVLDLAARLSPELEVRYAAHVAGTGAKYTRANPPVRVLASRGYPDRSAASRAEAQLKRLPRVKKLAFFQS